MREALIEARKAFEAGEVPVGAVIVSNEAIISRAFNRREKTGNPLDHAEIRAIGEASKELGSWRLDGCTIYVTLEPCPMCTGVILESRIRRLVFGASDESYGAAGSAINLADYPGFPRRVQIRSGILENECSALLSDFFKTIRQQ